MEMFKILLKYINSLL